MSSSPRAPLDDAQCAKSPIPGIRNDLSESVYIHEELALGSVQQIRLIKLLPGSSVHPLRCTLSTANLDDLPEYEALSYTWATENGDDKKSRQIYCDNGVLPITVNCHAALRQLRKVFAPRILWVDSICINQSNVGERNHQVGLMDRIYRLASMVHVCIHDSNHDYTESMSWLRSAKKHRKQNAIKQTTELFRRRYFTRVWVIQEIVLAKLAILHVNEDSVRLSPAVLTQLIDSCKDHEIPVQLRWASGSDRLNGVLDCLNLSFNAQSSVPRDAVYGILGLVKPHIRDLIPVDYSLSVDQVLGKALLACIAERQDLSILSYAWLPSDSDHHLASCFSSKEYNKLLHSKTPVDRPSWFSSSNAPNLSQIEGRPWRREVTVTNASYPTNQENNLEATADEECSVVEVIAASVPTHQILPGLRVRAHLIDITCGYPYGGITWVSRDFYRLGLSSCRSDPTREFFKAKWVPSYSGYSEADYPDHYKFIKSLPVNDSATVFRTYYSVGFTSRHLYRAGDYIFAIDGAPYPFLLRKIGQAKYRIVGMCYVWAALELDYWNPGTRKGIWLDRPYDLGQEQTQMIEIY